MLTSKTCIPGCLELQPRVHADERGMFVKTFHKQEFAALGLETAFEEQYYTLSVKRVLRGMHFQVPPADHVKVVHCVRGAVMDVVVDLRTGSPTFGKYFATVLDDQTGKGLYIPRGLAHGFCVLSDQALMLYNTSSAYAPRQDKGIRWDSLDIPWPEKDPILSKRDRQFPAFGEFTSPFRY